MNRNDKPRATGRARARRRPSLGLLVGLLALVVATSGTAYAVSVAPKNSVVSKSIKNGQVRPADLATGAVGSGKVKDGGIEYEDLAPESVGGDNLRPIWHVEVASAPTADADGQPNGGDHGIAEATATCPDGAQVLGGSAYWGSASSPGSENENVYLQASYRFGNGWRARGVVDFGAQGTIRLRVVALCLIGEGAPAA